MCAGFLIRSSFAFYIHLPQVVIPRLDVGSDAIHELGRAEWDSDTEEGNPDGRFQEESPKKRAKVDTAEKGAKKPEIETAVYGPSNEPQRSERRMSETYNITEPRVTAAAWIQNDGRGTNAVR